MILPKVCHITSVHGRYDGRIFQKQCKSLANAGFEVTLLCADNKQDEFIDGIMIRSVKFYPSNRFHRIISASLKLMEKAKQIDADYYHIHDPELLLLAYKLMKIGKKVFYDSHEDYGLNILQKHWIPFYLKKLISILFIKYESYVCEKLEGVVSVTPQIVNRFKKINRNVYLVPNFPILNKNEKIKVNNNKVICFAGAFSPDRMHFNIVKALEKLPNYIYKVAGPTNTEFLKKLKKLKGWSQVQYHGVISTKEVGELYKSASIGIVLENYTQLNYNKEGSLGVTKLFEYINNNLKVICTDFKIWKEIIEDNELGICINPNNVDSIVDAILKVENYQINQEKRESVCQNYSWNFIEPQFLKIYK